MVASISVRKSVAAAAAYYQHMGKDDYYAREGEAPVAGRGAPPSAFPLRAPSRNPTSKRRLKASIRRRENGLFSRTESPIRRAGT